MERSTKIILVFVTFIFLLVVIIAIIRNRNRKPVTTKEDITKAQEIAAKIKKEKGDSPYAILGLTGYYTFESYKGTVWNDVSGKKNHITEFGDKKPIAEEGFIVGTTESGFKIPNKLTSNEYTLVYFGAYNGSNKNKLISNSEKYTGNNYMIIGMTNSNGMCRLNGKNVDKTFELKINSNTESTSNTSESFVIISSIIPNKIEIQKDTIPLNNIPVSIKYIDTTSNIVDDTTVESKDGISEHIGEILNMYEVKDDDDSIVIKKKLEDVSVNMNDKTQEYSDFAFKEIAIWDRVLSENDMSRLEVYFRTAYSGSMKKRRGIKEDAIKSTISMQDVSAEKCRVKALLNKSKGFAINPNVGECVLYTEIEQLKGWEGGPSESDYVSMCTIPNAEISKGCQ
jgi:hypothetical protein